MANIKKEDKKRVFSVAISKSVVDFVDLIAEKQNVSRSMVIETIVRGWINGSIMKSMKEEGEKKDEC